MDLMLDIDRDSRISLVEQVYLGIRQCIADGTIARGARLPSTREFARQLGLTRFTVDDAYSRLISEGYLEGRHGSGTYVAEDAFLPGETGAAASDVAPPVRKLSDWASRLEPEEPAEFSSNPVTYNFYAGTPALDHWPLATWKRLIVRESRELDAARFTYSHTAGMLALREEIAAYVGRSRGVNCTADQVIVTSGSQQSMDLIMRMVLDPSSTVVTEDPCYRYVRRLASLTGARVHPVPVDGEGLKVDQLPEGDASVRLVCVTPSHQYPTGALLPLARRLALLRWAQRNEALVLEDDYDGELRYDSRPVPSLAALATSSTGANNVLYLGSFSKVLFPALRLGYIIVPPDLVEPFLHAKVTVERHAPALNQVVVAAFIAEGHFERHLARMRRVYSSRHDALVAAMDEHLGGIAFRDTAMLSAGLHVLTRFEVGMSETELERLGIAHGIGFEGASDCYITPPNWPHMYMGYAALPEERIHEGIALLGQLLRNR